MATTSCFTFGLAPGSPTVSLLGTDSYYDLNVLNFAAGATTHITFDLPAPTWSGQWEIYGDHLPEGFFGGTVTSGTPINVTGTISNLNTFLQVVLREAGGSAAPLGTYYCLTI